MSQNWNSKAEEEKARRKKVKIAIIIAILFSLGTINGLVDNITNIENKIIHLHGY
ncbi:MAG: hypothetical protein RR923_06090 [Bacilli bacterium]